jgi:prefoldin subunit 5
MASESLLRQFIRESLSKDLIELSSGKVVEYGSESHINELDRMIEELRSLKDTMRSGPERNTLRKEKHSLQRAIESIRYLKRKAERAGRSKGLLKT